MRLVSVKVEGEVVCCWVVVELVELAGRKRLHADLQSLLEL